MGPVLVTGPVLEPLELDEAKEHLRVTHTDDDFYIQMLIVAARKYAEGFQRRAYLTQTWKVYLDSFPWQSYIELPWAPLQSVTHLKYTDSDGDQSTFSSSSYEVDTSSEPGRIVLAYSESWPTDTLKTANAIEIQYVCGYGDAPAALPETIRQGLLILISDWYENRESVVVGQTPAEVPNTAKTLLWMDRVL